MLKTAIILAGGFGTRLKSVVRDVPKPMAPVNGKPFLHYQLLYLKHFGITHVIFSVGYMHEVIENYFGHSYMDMTITYARETETLGTGGGIRLALTLCQDKETLVLNGDSFFDCDISAVYQKHRSTRADCTLALRRVENAGRYGTILFNTENRITAFIEKTQQPDAGTINAGVYILHKNTYLSHVPAQGAFSIEKDFFEKKLTHLHFTGIEFNAYFIDIGLPEDYAQAQDDFKRFTY